MITAVRIVDFVWRDRRGVILGLGNSQEPWSPVPREEAISHIRAGQYRYVTVQDGSTAEVRIYRNQFLRTASDDELANNLDQLDPATDAGAFGATGTFDVVIAISQDALIRLGRTLHAAEVYAHHDTTFAGGYELDLLISPPRLAAPSAAPARDAALVATTVAVTAHSAGESDDWFSTLAELRTDATMTFSVSGPPNPVIELGIRYRPDAQQPVRLLGPLPDDHKARVTEALTRWMSQTVPGAWTFSLPPALASTRRVRATIRPEGTLQVGLSRQANSLVDLFSEPVPADWSLAMSRWRVAQEIYSALAANLSALPPPEGDEPVLLDSAQNLYLDRLIVTLDNGAVILSGAIRRDATLTVTASFEA